MMMNYFLAPLSWVFHGASVQVIFFKEHALGYRKCQWSIVFKGPFLGDLQNLKAHKLGTNRCIQGVPDISRVPPPTGSPTALWQNYCRETHLLTSHPYLDGCCLC